MNTIGNKNLFAIEYKFVPDPDNGKASLPEESLSWGCFAIWIHGRNICQYSYNNEIVDAVSWYIYPVLQWFSMNWNPLLYEEPPPVPTDKTVARAMFFEEYTKNIFGFMSEQNGAAWYDWGQRHSLRSCSNGGIFPDLFIRALGENIEFSWGNAEIPGIPAGLFFTAPFGSQEVKRHEVKNVLSQFLIETTRYLIERMPESEELQKLHELAKKSCTYDREEQLSWMIPALRERQKSIIELFDNPVLQKSFEVTKEDYIPACVGMFGSISPTIEKEDIDIIINSICAGCDTEQLQKCIKNTPIPNRDQYISGYDLAADFIEDYSNAYSVERVSIEEALENFDIQILERRFSDTGMSGVALAGEGIKPTIFINLNHPNNSTENGLRFTKAHEFCHLLFDRQYGKEVGISSGAWAPAGVEKRAKAFAAMLLMPSEIIFEKIEKHPDIANFIEIQAIAKDLQVSTTALIEHLCNIGAISTADRDRLREENSHKIE